MIVQVEVVIMSPCSAAVVVIGNEDAVGDYRKDADSALHRTDC